MDVIDSNLTWQYAFRDVENHSFRSRIVNSDRCKEPRCLQSRFFDERRKGAVVDTIVIHSMFNPDADDNFCVHSCKALLDSRKVSTHYIIDRAGEVWRSVPEEQRAWHAGESCIPDATDARSGVNHFSIGIELIGSHDSGFTPAQYEALARLSCQIAKCHAIRQVYGHADIAPARKSDPWNFDWARYAADLKRLGGDAANIRVRPGI